MANVMYVGDAWQRHRDQVLRGGTDRGRGLIIVATDDLTETIEAIAETEWFTLDITTLEAQGRLLDLVRQRLPLSAVHYALPFEPALGAEAQERFLKQGVMAPRSLLNAVLALTGVEPCSIKLYESGGSSADSAAINAYWQAWIRASDPSVSCRVQWIPRASG
jgi:hypothetical protein